MISIDEASEVITIADHAFHLLMYLRDGTDHGKLSPRASHRLLSDGVAFRKWLKDSFDDLPVNARPVGDEPMDVEPFAQFFMSYLRCSFDFVPYPAQIEMFVSDFCCEWCSPPRFRRESYLRKKKIRYQDTQTARQLIESVLVELAAMATNAALPSPALIQGLLRDREVEEAVAVVAYVEECHRRCSGGGNARASLALWRKFAWGSLGSPKNDFSFSLSRYRGALAQIEAAVNSQNCGVIIP